MSIIFSYGRTEMSSDRSALYLKPVPRFGSSQPEYYCPRAEVFKPCSGKLCTLDKGTLGLLWGVRGAGMVGPWDLIFSESPFASYVLDFCIRSQLEKRFHGS